MQTHFVFFPILSVNGFSLTCMFQDVIEKSHLSGDYFTAYLHQNYIEFYTDISDLVRSTEYLSDSDYLTVDWSVSRN